MLGNKEGARKAISPGVDRQQGPGSKRDVRKGVPSGERELQNQSKEREPFLFLLPYWTVCIQSLGRDQLNRGSPVISNAFLQGFPHLLFFKKNIFLKFSPLFKTQG